MIVDSSSGELVVDKPWMIIFIKPIDDLCKMMKPNIDAIAEDLNGTVQFAFVNANDPVNERLRLSFWAYRPPMSFFIDPDTKSAYVFDQIVYNYNETI